jgi:hypothetical protein
VCDEPVRRGVRRGCAESAAHEFEIAPEYAECTGKCEHPSDSIDDDVRRIWVSTAREQDWQQDHRRNLNTYEKGKSSKPEH